MDKAILLNQIKNSKVSEPFKDRLLSIVRNAPELTEKVMNEVNKTLDEYANSLLEDIKNLEIQDAAQQMNKALDELDQDIDKFNADLNKRADEIDLNTLRSNLK